MMHRFTTARRLLTLAMLLGLGPSAPAAEPFQWKTATPQSQGLSKEKLDALAKDLAARGTKDLLVIRNDRIVYEWYAEGRGPADRHYTASMAKAVVGGMSLAVAMQDGLVDLDDPVSKFVPQWLSDPRKSKITFRQLGSHTSGLEDSSVAGYEHTKEPGWKGEFWKKLDPPNDPFTISRDRTPVLFEPGTGSQYSNPGIAMLTYGITAALRDQPIKDVRTLLRERLFTPIGISPQEWSVGYGKTFNVDGLPIVAAWGGGEFTPRAVARIGRLVMRKGDWDGQKLLSPDVIARITDDAGTPGNGAMGWWTNREGTYPDLPRDVIWGAGAQHQLLFVAPGLQLIAVRNGPQSLDDSDYSNAAAHRLFEPLLAAVTSNGDRTIVKTAPAGKAPYPPSPVIAGIDWAPKDSIRRDADGCDNWPVTWADDGHLYTAYGDGNGFKPYIDHKLSVGLAKISGGPLDCQGVNVRSQDLEEPGDGAKGRKASGMLCIDGTLYILLRNASNSVLGWSKDHGVHWTFADWKFTDSFGAPTFLNFGRNYAGARDDFVYIYSTDGDSAYVPSDRMVLARVPKDQLPNREAYEFFVQLDGRGRPEWSKDFDARGAVFSHPGRCCRGGVTYNAGLQRYLWCQVLPESTDSRGARFRGGFGVYDAPEPWGPWTTVDFTNDWDVGPGESSSFPTKWMSGDGRTVHLLFSGDDHFSVREGTLKLK